MDNCGIKKNAILHSTIDIERFSERVMHSNVNFHIARGITIDIETQYRLKK